MEFYEMETLVNNIWMKDKESWDQARLIINWCQQSTKPVNMFEKMTFPWDVDNTEKVEDTQEERDAIMKEMKEWEKIMNKK